MIYDSICNIEKYKDDSKLYAALETLKQYVAGEEYDKNSVSSFNNMKCNTMSWKDAKMENHHKYTDIHYVIEGTEKILISNREDLERLTEYSENNDFELFALPDDVESAELHEGDFLVVYPGESHAPKVAVEEIVAPIHKVVVKL